MKLAQVITYSKAIIFCNTSFQKILCFDVQIRNYVNKYALIYIYFKKKKEKKFTLIYKTLINSK